MLSTFYIFLVTFVNLLPHFIDEQIEVQIS